MSALTDSLGVDEGDVIPSATLQADLGAESIDFLDIVFRLERKYCTELRGYPRITAGWLMVPTAATMAATTFLTTWFHRRSLRHVWLIVGLVGSAACVWWMSSIDNFTGKERLALMLACWGAFLGLIPPVFQTDEIERIDPKDMLYAGALGVVGLVVPIITVPTATGTVVREWSDRALDVYRHNLRENRPAVEQASARVGDYFHQRRTERGRPPAGDEPCARRLRDARERRSRVPQRLAIPQPDDA